MSECGRSDNPFTSQRIRPDAFAFLFGPEDGTEQDGIEQDCTEQLVGRLQQQDWWGQIVGPHGSGKSTLLATLIPAIENAAGCVTVLELHDGQRRLPMPLRGEGLLQDTAVLAVDGYEQLAHLHRMRLKRFCRRAGVGLLVTSHASVGLPPLWRTQINRKLARQVVDRLQAGYPSLITVEDIAQAFDACQGDLREMLFGLYDVYEARRRGSPPDDLTVRKT